MMNKILLQCVFVLVCAFGFVSCDNTLDLIEPGSDTPIVYALLSASSPQQFIRVERGFVDPVKSAEEIAQIADSLYYPNVTVSLVNVTSDQTFNLQRVNAEDFGYTRDDGFFATDPNIVYVHDGDVDDFKPADIVRVEVDRGDSFEKVTAEVQLLEELLIVNPSTQSVINFPTKAQYKMQWVAGDINPAKSYIVNFYLNYNEADLADVEPDFEPYTIKWNFANVGDEKFAEVAGIEFYKFLGNNLEKSPTLVRTFESFDVEVIYSGKEMEKYQDFLGANTGITSSQPIPPYTNLSSGLGLVAEREVIWVNDVFVGVPTKDSLRLGTFTKDLGFQ